MQIRSQEVHLLQIRPGGSFVLLRKLGWGLQPQDMLTLSLQEEHEARWQASQVQAPLHGVIMLMTVLEFTTSRSLSLYLVAGPAYPVPPGVRGWPAGQPIVTLHFVTLPHCRAGVGELCQLSLLS